MLSIIISSYQPDYFTALEKNIAETCGVPYEIIKVDNQGIMGICEAYNEGAEKAIYDYLLFLHEDVLFETINWGEILTKYFENPNRGVIGVAGSNYIPNVPFAWWDNFENEYRNMQQYIKGGTIREYKLQKDEKVYSLDGVFMACTKEIFRQYHFDENIKGFHSYDLNFSIRVGNVYQNLVSSKIMIRHFSEGTKNKDWFINLVNYRKTFQKPDLQAVDKKKEAYFFLKYINYLKEFNITAAEKRKLLLPYICPKYIGWKLSLKTIFNLIFP